MYSQFSPVFQAHSTDHKSQNTSKSQPIQYNTDRFFYTILNNNITLSNQTFYKFPLPNQAKPRKAISNTTMGEASADAETPFLSTEQIPLEDPPIIRTGKTKTPHLLLSIKIINQMF